MLKDVKGFEGEYMVSDCGELYSVKNGSPVLLKGGSNGKYRSFSLRKDGVQYQKSLHRLVAEAFIENPEDKPEVNHIDGNKLNNTPENLEWVSSKDNKRHAILAGKYKNLGKNSPKGEDSKKAKLTENQVKEIRKRVAGGEFKRAIAREYGVSDTLVRFIVERKTWKHI